MAYLNYRYCLVQMYLATAEQELPVSALHLIEMMRLLKARIDINTKFVLIKKGI